MLVKIPRGTKNNQIIKLNKCGNFHPDRAVGDVDIKVVVEQHATFSYIGPNLHYYHQITIQEAVEQSEFCMTNLCGEKIW